MLAVLQNANSNPTGKYKGLDELKATWLHSFFYLLDNEQGVHRIGSMPSHRQS